mgnify:CR=1 FL=1
MKKCTKCHKNIPSDAKVCPYCGTPQPGYQPMKRTPKRKNAFLYYILIAVLLFFPMGISYFFAFNTLSNTETSATKTTLKTYQEAKNETFVYEYNSLADFSKNVKGSKKYAQKIKQIETSLNEIVGSKNVKTNYTFQVTANSNVYVDANYIISLDQQNKMNISYQYDLSKESDLTYNYYLKEINQLDEAVQTLQENEEKIQNILYIFNGKDNKKLISKTIDDFKTKEAEFATGVLSHYGQGIHNSSEDDKSSIRVFKSKEKYRVQFSYNSKLKNKKFLLKQKNWFFFLN